MWVRGAVRCGWLGEGGGGGGGGAWKVREGKWILVSSSIQTSVPTPGRMCVWGGTTLMMVHVQ